MNMEILGIIGSLIFYISYNLFLQLIVFKKIKKGLTKTKFFDTI